MRNSKATASSTHDASRTLLPFNTHQRKAFSVYVSSHWRKNLVGAWSNMSKKATRLDGTNLRSQGCTTGVTFAGHERIASIELAALRRNCTADTAVLLMLEGTIPCNIKQANSKTKYRELEVRTPPHARYPQKIKKQKERNHSLRLPQHRCKYQPPPSAALTIPSGIRTGTQLCPLYNNFPPLAPPARWSTTETPAPPQHPTSPKPLPLNPLVFSRHFNPTHFHTFLTRILHRAVLESPLLHSQLRVK